MSLSSASPRRPARLLLIAAVTIAAAAVMALAAPAPAHAAAPTGCAYATSGPAAGTLCWIDLAAYDPVVASTPAGQPLGVSLPGGYTATFALHTTAGEKPVAASAFPTWSGAAIGNVIYTGIPSTIKPALNQDATTQALTTTTIRLDTIVVRDAGGQVVHGWRIIGADAESTANSESITFAADTPLSDYISYSATVGGNGCQANLTFGPGALTATCTGNAAVSGYGTQLIAATEPTFFTQTMQVTPFTFAAEAVAFAFQSATVQGDLSVPIRASAGDTFDVTLTSPEAAVVGTGSTGAATTASTTALTVLPRVAGQPFRLTATGSNLAAYSLAWACSRNGVADPALSASGVATITVQPAAGEAVACTVTASRLAAAAAPAPARPELAATGSSAEPLTGVVGSALVVAGALLVLSARTRRRIRSH